MRDRPVCARAIVQQIVVASVPFLANMAQSACRDSAHKQLGQLDHDRAGPVLAVGQLGLGGGRRLHRRVLVPEHDRAVAAHQVHVLVAVHIPDPRAPALAHELRVLRRQRASGLMPVHAARDYRPGPAAQLLRPRCAAGDRAWCLCQLLGHATCSPVLIAALRALILLVTSAAIRSATGALAARRKSSTCARLSGPASEPRPVATSEPHADAQPGGVRRRRSPAAGR